MQLTLGPLFGDHMVLQQGVPAPVWGTVAPGADVVVAFRGQRASTKADATGRWSVRLAPLAASAAPAELTVVAAVPGSPEARWSARDVLVGEVWVCSGQSNMQMAVSESNEPAKEIAGAEFPAIRLFTVPRRPAAKPMDDLPGATWSVCSGRSVTDFSAVAYFFGRELHRRLGVPVGLINASWGGTVAEAWTSREGLLNEPTVRELAVDYEGDTSLAQRQAEYRAQMRALEELTGDRTNVGFGKGWAGVGEPSGEWQDMRIPGTWKARGLDFHGILWFRTAADVPAAWAGKDLELSIGATDKSDTTYFNGEKVGGVSMKDRPDAWSFIRVYTVPGRLVKPGRNVISVRVHSDMYAAGMTGPAELMKLNCPTLADAGAEAIPLAGTWRYAVEANYGQVVPPPLPAGPDNPNSPSVLYNGLIAPLVPFAICGVIWYQGESNAERARQYRTLFPALIRDWRRRWGRDDLAFHFVQLANFMEPQDGPCESRWAELREAQTMALSLPHTGMAVAIDIGDAVDIHPKNKQEVGRRLAFNALNKTYGLRDVTPCGPLFKEARREGRAMRLIFEHAEGLVFRGGEPQGFAIAGADRHFVWADARIEGPAVVVESDAVLEPVAVRYGWADNPICNLYNAAGLPASPFRTDPG